MVDGVTGILASLDAPAPARLRPVVAAHAQQIRINGYHAHVRRPMTPWYVRYSDMPRQATATARS
jgi:hypothetical protein